MSMQLLSKSEIVKAQNNDKAREIAEGLKITKRVDSLRELMAREEEALDKFRDESLAAIMKEISDLNSSKEEVFSEVRQLREERELGMEEVRQRSENLESLAHSLELRSAEQNAKESELQERLKDAGSDSLKAKKELQRAENHKEEANRLHQEALNAIEDARIRLESVRLTEERVNESIEEASRNLASRIGIVEAREKCVLAVEETNREFSKELNDLKEQLQDQRSTLQRSIERFNKTGKP